MQFWRSGVQRLRYNITRICAQRQPIFNTVSNKVQYITYNKASHRMFPVVYLFEETFFSKYF